MGDEAIGDITPFNFISNRIAVGINRSGCNAADAAANFELRSDGQAGRGFGR